MSQSPVKVAVVQRPPVLLDRAATTDSLVRSVAEAAAEGAGLVVFPETFLPGYPVWIWKLRPEQYALSEEIHGRLLSESVDLSAGDLSPVQEAAATAGAVVVCGIHEREGAYGRATLYNTLVTIGPDGSILNRHRKLVPTNPERMVWGRATRPDSVSSTRRSAGWAG
jgi:nitrilase